MAVLRLSMAALALLLGVAAAAASEGSQSCVAQGSESCGARPAPKTSAASLIQKATKSAKVVLRDEGADAGKENSTKVNSTKSSCPSWCNTYPLVTKCSIPACASCQVCPEAESTTTTTTTTTPLPVGAGQCQSWCGRLPSYVQCTGVAFQCGRCPVCLTTTTTTTTTTAGAACRQWCHTYSMVTKCSQALSSMCGGCFGCQAGVGGVNLPMPMPAMPPR
uniref:ShKT domain-containing protein n=1 Tax=Alexandrium catenella TaxID=2925 RepID=A0A7S1S105_ALECA